MSFHEAVGSVFQNWTALQLAVTQGAAGPQSSAIAKWMVEATVQWFAENKDLECYEVEEFLTEVISNEFNVIIDDGSLREVSQLICEFYALAISVKEESRAELLRRLQALPKCDLSQCKVEDAEAETNGMEVDDDDDDDDETPKFSVQTNKPDDDGWTVVSRKKK